MQKPILIDTAFVLALVNKHDQLHENALTLAEQFDGYPSLITDAILLEIGNALVDDHKQESIKIIEQFFDSEETKIIHLTPDLFNKAFELYKKYTDKSWGLVDCISFIVMWEFNITQALTFDQHFVQAGFQALMRDL
ncbi:MAG: PIN domain-containing protein [Candidatus Marithrix sp.]